MAQIKIYTTKTCHYCTSAKALLDRKHLTYQEIFVDADPAKREEMERLSGRRTVPQIFIDDKSIGGYDDLSALDKSGELNNLM
jgi:glutaredoxin 3